MKGRAVQRRVARVRRTAAVVQAIAGPAVARRATQGGAQMAHVGLIAGFRHGGQKGNGQRRVQRRAIGLTAIPCTAMCPRDRVPLRCRQVMW
jgi:hypothetical protein